MEISGYLLEACNCDAACPCVLLGAPTKGECTVLVAWHIHNGHFGETNLDGLNTVLAAYSPGHMLQTKWKVALYMERGAPLRTNGRLSPRSLRVRRAATWRTLRHALVRSWALRPFRSIITPWAGDGA